MLPHQAVVAEILALPEDPSIGAFFDFDGTIISGYSMVAFVREEIRRGRLSPRDLVELLSVGASFGAGALGFAALMLSTSQFLRGVREDRYVEFG
jgi:putative phosphoserine phosphatase/1-acylglycerol-3-phosphate O-acyltransferase